MHEKERHRIIQSAVQEKPVVTVQELVDLTDSSEATIRRDIAAVSYTHLTLPTTERV